MKRIIAIDPGKSGGVVIGYKNGCESILCDSMPETETDLVDLLAAVKSAALVENEEPPVAYVEKVGGYVGKRQPGSTMFKFGFGCGVIEGALRALGIRTIYVRPQEWQKHFSLCKASSCDSKTEWKNVLKREAQRRFPSNKVTLATADALLILDYARAQP